VAPDRRINVKRSLALAVLLLAVTFTPSLAQDNLRLTGSGASQWGPVPRTHRLCAMGGTLQILCYVSMSSRGHVGDTSSFS
jgi:hypothetical protein